MGTSSARRGPTTGLWRAAKRAATRYLAPESGGELNAREVAARYLAALEETPGQGDCLAAFRLTRKVGLKLGAFWAEVNSRGLNDVLSDSGLKPLARKGSPEMLAQGLSGLMAGSGGSLEEAVARTSLALVLGPAVKSENRAASTQIVRQFLVTAFTLRLILDLGEPLEASAGSYGRLKDGLNRLKELIEVSIPEVDGQPESPATLEHWQGLTGWIWITEIMAALMAKLKGRELK